MDENKKLAIELAKAFIQNSSVKPIYNKNYDDDSNTIVYVVGDSQFSFCDIAHHFMKSNEKFESYY